MKKRAREEAARQAQIAQGWPPDWSWSDDALLVLERIDHAFGALEKPFYFTNVGHCPECRAHHESLNAHPVLSLRRANLGHEGDDPLNFATVEGIAHLFPGWRAMPWRPRFGRIMTGTAIFSNSISAITGSTTVSCSIATWRSDPLSRP